MKLFPIETIVENMRRIRAARVLTTHHHALGVAGALWQRYLTNSPWLPPVKGMERQIVDI